MNPAKLILGLALLGLAAFFWLAIGAASAFGPARPATLLSYWPVAVLAIGGVILLISARPQG